MSGGTDIVSCFAGGNPTAPVFRGELQAVGLGMSVEVFDEDGRSVRERERGAGLHAGRFRRCRSAFWNDPDGRKYHAAYFDRFPGVWTHGDYVEDTAHDGMIIYGRSDAVLNPGGVRIGTAEIYRQVEQLPEVLESLVIGQHWDNDERIVLFVRLQDGLTLDGALIDRIRRQVRDNTTPRHVPARSSSRSRTFRARRAARSSSSPFATSSTGARSGTGRRWPIPEALEQFRNRPELAR